MFRYFFFLFFLSTVYADVNSCSFQLTNLIGDPYTKAVQLVVNMKNIQSLRIVENVPGGRYTFFSQYLSITSGFAYDVPGPSFTAPKRYVPMPYSVRAEISGLNLLIMSPIFRQGAPLSYSQSPTHPDFWTISFFAPPVNPYAGSVDFQQQVGGSFVSVPSFSCIATVNSAPYVPLFGWILGFSDAPFYRYSPTIFSEMQFFGSCPGTQTPVPTPTFNPSVNYAYFNGSNWTTVSTTCTLTADNSGESYYQSTQACLSRLWACTDYELGLSSLVNQFSILMGIQQPGTMGFAPLLCTTDQCEPMNQISATSRGPPMTPYTFGEAYNHPNAPYTYHMYYANRSVSGTAWNINFGSMIANSISSSTERGIYHLWVVDPTDFTFVAALDMLPLTYRSAVMNVPFGGRTSSYTSLISLTPRTDIGPYLDSVTGNYIFPQRNMRLYPNNLVNFPNNTAVLQFPPKYYRSVYRATNRIVQIGSVYYMAVKLYTRSTVSSAFSIYDPTRNSVLFQPVLVPGFSTFEINSANSFNSIWAEYATNAALDMGIQFSIFGSPSLTDDTRFYTPNGGPLNVEISNRTNVQILSSAVLSLTQFVLTFNDTIITTTIKSNLISYTCNTNILALNIDFVNSSSIKFSHASCGFPLQTVTLLIGAVTSLTGFIQTPILNYQLSGAPNNFFVALNYSATSTTMTVVFNNSSPLLASSITISSIQYTCGGFTPGSYQIQSIAYSSITMQFTSCPWIPRIVTITTNSILSTSEYVVGSAYTFPEPNLVALYYFNESVSLDPNVGVSSLDFSQRTIINYAPSDSQWFGNLIRNIGPGNTLNGETNYLVQSTGIQFPVRRSTVTGTPRVLSETSPKIKQLERIGFEIWMSPLSFTPYTDIIAGCGSSRIQGFYSLPDIYLPENNCNPDGTTLRPGPGTSCSPQHVVISFAYNIDNFMTFFDNLFPVFDIYDPSITTLSPSFFAGRDCGTCMKCSYYPPAPIRVAPPCSRIDIGTGKFVSDSSVLKFVPNFMQGIGYEAMTGNPDGTSVSGGPNFARAAIVVPPVYSSQNSRAQQILSSDQQNNVSPQYNVFNKPMSSSAPKVIFARKCVDDSQQAYGAGQTIANDGTRTQFYNPAMNVSDVNTVYAFYVDLSTSTSATSITINIKAYQGGKLYKNTIAPAYATVYDNIDPNDVILNSFGTTPDKSSAQFYYNFFNCTSTPANSITNNHRLSLGGLYLAQPDGSVAVGNPAIPFIGFHGTVFKLAFYNGERTDDYANTWYKNLPANSPPYLESGVFNSTINEDQFLVLSYATQPGISVKDFDVMVYGVDQTISMIILRSPTQGQLYFNGSLVTSYPLSAGNGSLLNYTNTPYTYGDNYATIALQFFDGISKSKLTYSWLINVKHVNHPPYLFTTTYFLSPTINRVTLLNIDGAERDQGDRVRIRLFTNSSLLFIYGPDGNQSSNGIFSPGLSLTCFVRPNVVRTQTEVLRFQLIDDFGSVSTVNGTINITVLSNIIVLTTIINTDENVPAIINFAGQDTFNIVTEFYILITSLPSSGSLNVSGVLPIILPPNTQIVYTPNRFFIGFDFFGFYLSDGANQISEPAKFAINVAKVNQQPFFDPQPSNQSNVPNTPFSPLFTIALHDVDSGPDEVIDAIKAAQCGGSVSEGACNNTIQLQLSLGGYLFFTVRLQTTGTYMILNQDTVKKYFGSPRFFIRSGTFLNSKDDSILFFQSDRDIAIELLTNMKTMCPGQLGTSKLIITISDQSGIPLTSTVYITCNPGSSPNNGGGGGDGNGGVATSTNSTLTTIISIVIYSLFACFCMCTVCGPYMTYKQMYKQFQGYFYRQFRKSDVERRKKQKEQEEEAARKKKEKEEEEKAGIYEVIPQVEI